MGLGSRPFHLEYEFVEVKDAQERLNKAYAIVLAAGRRYRQAQREAARAETEATGAEGTHGEAVASS